MPREGVPTMTTPHTKPSARLSPIVELRQYDLVPGKRDTLIAIFDSHLVEGQELEEMVIIGQFRDLDNPDSFVWVRGFADMEARRRALTGFYSGPVWLANRDAANATMLRFDNVLLLKPAAQDGGFALHIADRPISPAVISLGAQQRARGRRETQGAGLAREIDGCGARRLVPLRRCGKRRAVAVQRRAIGKDGEGDEHRLIRSHRQCRIGVFGGFGHE